MNQISVQKEMSNNVNGAFMERMRIYAQLMRLDKPIGTLLLLWPTWWALLIAGNGRPDWLIVLMFTIGTFLMRSAGCVINDYADRHYDGAVARTSQRPFALKQVSKKEALLLTLLLCGLAGLCLLPLNSLTWKMSLPAVFLAMTYPFTKRFFPLPQLYLGIAFSFGIPMAFAAVSGHLPIAAWILMAANTLWTLGYDTIYAMADKEDDLKINIRTAAITFGRYDIFAVMLCYFGFDLLMVVTGWLIDAYWPFWLVMPLVWWWQYRQYVGIRSRNRHTCFIMFSRNNRLGALWFVGLLLNYCYAMS